MKHFLEISELGVLVKSSFKKLSYTSACKILNPYYGPTLTPETMVLAKWNLLYTMHQESVM